MYVDTEINGYDIKAGSRILFNVYAIIRGTSQMSSCRRGSYRPNRRSTVLIILISIQQLLDFDWELKMLTKLIPKRQDIEDQGHCLLLATPQHALIPLRLDAMYCEASSIGRVFVFHTFDWVLETPFKLALVFLLIWQKNLCNKGIKILSTFILCLQDLSNKIILIK